MGEPKSHCFGPRIWVKDEHELMGPSLEKLRCSFSAQGSWDPREAQNRVHTGDVSCLCVSRTIHSTPPADLGCVGDAEMSV